MFGRQWVALAAAVAVAAAIVGSMTRAAAGASSRARSHKPPVVSPRFRHVVDADWIWTGTRYALAGQTRIARPSVTLIDDQTGRVKTMTRAGCVPVDRSALEPLDLPWVLFDCNPIVPLGTAPLTPAPELYSRRHRRVAVGLPQPSDHGASVRR